MIPRCLAKHIPLHPCSHAINPNMYQVCVCHAKLTMTQKECANNLQFKQTQKEFICSNVCK